MKRVLLAASLIFAMLLSSCVGVKKNEKILNMGFESAAIDRIVITNNRGGVKYTIIDEKSISRIKNIVVRATDVTEDSKLDPDFTIDFYAGTKTIGTFNYIAGINDDKTANFADLKGDMFHISTQIEDEFIKRIMRMDSSQNVSQYYVSLIQTVINNANIADGSTVVVDMKKDYNVLQSVLSVDQRKILDNIDTKGVKVKFPEDVKSWDYYITINTKSYTDTTSNAVVSVTDKNNNEKDYSVQGTFENNGWSYFITFK